MSSLSNEGVVAELGWTMQILTDSNHGKIPAFWRPPFGDCDNRVRAIAKEVFGLTNVIWGMNSDSEDWHLTNSAAEDASVRGECGVRLTARWKHVLIISFV
jgi:chitin deacetylase